MNKSTLLSTGILAVAVLAGAFIVSTATAESIDDLAYPIAELGDCASASECKTYCDDFDNAVSCLAFAEKRGLMSADDLAKARAVVKLGEGPGGCKNPGQCEAYCDDVNNINECIAFAEKNGLMSGPELEEAKKVQSAIARGVKPPPCGGKNKCDVYCSDPQNMEQCMVFAKEAGLMSEQEIAEADRFLQAVKKGAKPPPCRGKAECDKYCADENNFPVCVEFAEAAGFMSAEEAAMARKSGGKGPGGCFGEECKVFCEKPENQETCFQFAVEHGMIRPEDQKRMDESRMQISKELSSENQPEVIQCIREAVGDETFEKMKSGVQMPSPKLGQIMESCFQQFGKPGQDANSTGTGPSLDQILEKMPPQVKDCIVSKVSVDELRQSQDPSKLLDAVIPGCFGQFGGSQGGEMQGPPPGGGMMPPEGMQPPEGFQRPPEGSAPPEGAAPVPPSTYPSSSQEGAGFVAPTPVEGNTVPVESIAPPPSEGSTAPAEYVAPPPPATETVSPEAPTSSSNDYNFTASVLDAFRTLFLLK